MGRVCCSEADRVFVLFFFKLLLLRGRGLMRGVGIVTLLRGGANDVGPKLGRGEGDDE